MDGEIGALYWSGLAVLTGQTGVPEIGSIVATEVCLYRTTVSEPGLSRRTGKPFEEGVTKALATHTGSFLVQACSRMHGCAGRGGSRLLWVGIHASTSNSQAGGILTVSTRATVIGEFGTGCGCIKGIGGCLVICKVRFPMSRIHWLARRKSRPRIASVVSPSAITTVAVNGMSERRMVRSV